MKFVILSVDYNAIFKRSWEIVKREKVLWLYGVILAAFSGGGGGGGGNYSNLFRLFENQDKLPQQSGEKVSQVLGAITTNPAEFFASLFWSLPWFFWLALILGIIVTVVFFIGLNLFMVNWSTGALFQLSREAERGTKLTPRLGAVLGLRSWKRLLATQLVIWGISLLLILGAVLILPFFLIDSTGLRILLILALVIYILLAVIFSIFMLIWHVFVTLLVTQEDFALHQALSLGWKLAKKYVWKAVVLGFLHFAIAALLGIFIGIGALVVLGILGLIVVGLFFTNRIVGIIAAAIVGIPAIFLLGCLLLVFGIYKAFTNTNWALFYGELKKKEDWVGLS